MTKLLEKKFRLRNSVAMVYDKNHILNFFKTNVRESKYLGIDCDISGFLQRFDGDKILLDILRDDVFREEDIVKLVLYLNENKILIEQDVEYNESLFLDNYRIINFLEEFCKKTSEVVASLNRLNQSAVLIFGLGGVGSWVVDLLARSGVKNFILVDDDTVDITNIHRQDLFFPNQLGKFKIDCVEEELHIIDSNIRCKKIYKKLDENFFLGFDDNFDLAINCADYPNVDTTTKLLGSECMNKNIPHIIGGGYNLHLTLIGQSVIPFQSACYECFSTKLQEINSLDTKGLKKLHRKTRKIGSFTPLCTTAASIASLEAIKILCGFYDSLVNCSKRIEFSLDTMDFHVINIERNPACKVCARV